MIFLTILTKSEKPPAEKRHCDTRTATKGPRERNRRGSLLCACRRSHDRLPQISNFVRQGRNQPSSLRSFCLVSLSQSAFARAGTALATTSLVTLSIRKRLFRAARKFFMCPPIELTPQNGLT